MILFLYYVCLRISVYVSALKDMLYQGCKIFVFYMGTETEDGSDDEDAADGYRARASTKKEKKRQEREAQRQVKISKGHFIIIM